MTTVVTWVVQSVVIAGLLTLAALAWEGSTRWSGASARWGWLVALAGSVGLPWLLRVVPRESWPEVVPAGVAVPLLQPLHAAAAGPAAGWSAAEVAVAGWLLASATSLAMLVLMLVRLERARRGWRTVELEGGPVCVARDMGPAAVGIARGAVVIPAWVLELEAELRSLLVVHEREHVRAGDPRLLLAGLLLMAAVPWNPLLWLQLVRLRNAIELDCDARVLRTGVSPRRYGTLLLEVGRRRSGSTLVMATFSEPRAYLEQRIRRIAQWPLHRSRMRALGLALVAVGLFATALSARDPSRPVSGDASGAALPGPLVSDTPPERRELESRPTFTPFTTRPELLDMQEVQAALARNYPPLLRDAGIGGTALVWFFIDEEGAVARTLLSRTTGYPALDSAALRVARGMRFSPARNRDQLVPVWVEIPIVFSTGPSDGFERRRMETGEPPAGAPPPPQPPQPGQPPPPAQQQPPPPPPQPGQPPPPPQRPPPPDTTPPPPAMRPDR